MIIIDKKIACVEPNSASNIRSESHNIILSLVETVTRSVSLDEKNSEQDLYCVYTQMVSGNKILAYQGRGIEGRDESIKRVSVLSMAIAEALPSIVKSDQ